MEMGTNIVLDELKIISAIALGLVIYQTPLPGRVAPAQPEVKSPQFPLEQV
jgi:hypothetical protein